MLWGGVISSVCAGAQTTAIEVNSNGQMVFPDNGATSTKELVFGNQGANDWAIEKWNGGLNFWKLNGTGAGDNKLYINDAGNIGVGTAAPSSKLDVRGIIRAQTGFILEGDASNASAPYWNAAYFNNSGNNWSAVLYPHTDAQLIIGKQDKRVQVFARQIWSEVYSSTSDERIKENIHPIGTPLTKITKLKGVQYDVKKAHISDSAALLRKGKRDTRKDNLGFLAQDLRKVFPELVLEQDSTGLLGINYIGLIPVLVEALKEQQVQIAMLQQQVAVLAKDNNSTTKGKSSLKSGESNATETATSATTDANDNITLYQNTPNPFSAVTEIKMDLPKSVSDARLAVYNLAGEQKLSLPIAERGLASVRIEDSQLMPGIYIYGIIADGQLAASKQMVVTE